MNKRKTTGTHSGKFNYSKAEADLYDAGASHPEEIYEYHSEKAVRGFMKEHGLNPEKYYGKGNAGRKSGRFGTNSNADGNSSEGCYLTTACTAARGLPDDCDELQSLRAFRDGYLSGRPEGASEIEAYYSVAPLIVSAINSRPDSAQIWEQVYSDLVVPCVHMIKQEQNEQAYHHYKEYSFGLYSKYIGSIYADEREMPEGE